MSVPEIKPPSTKTRLRHILRQLVKPVSLERRAEVQVQLREAAHPDFDFFFLVILSSVIATLGLLTNSGAVIIGAMLVAPLMSPIIALGLASMSGDEKLLRDSGSALVRGAVVSILIAILFAWSNRFLPFVTLQELPVEILSRTRPSPIDLTIALAGGMAAAFALAQPQLSAALPGVAIATALMPPLCTVGVGVALGRWDIAGGALLLFITNAVTIAFAAMLIFFLLGFTPRRTEGSKLPRGLVYSALFTLALLIPLTLLSAHFVRQANERRDINNVVAQEVRKVGGDMTDLQLTQSGDTLQMSLTIRTTTRLEYRDVVSLQRDIAYRLQKPVSIVVNQIIAARLDPLIPPTFTSTATPVTLTPTLTLTPTATATSTATATLIPPTPTATPSTARIANTNGRTYIDMLQEPGGPSIGRLRLGDHVLVLYGNEVANGLVWLEVQDQDGRIGWIPQINLFTITLTPSPTLPVTPATQTATP